MIMFLAFYDDSIVTTNDDELGEIQGGIRGA